MKIAATRVGAGGRAASYIPQECPRCGVRRKASKSKIAGRTGLCRDCFQAVGRSWTEGDRGR